MTIDIVKFQLQMVNEEGVRGKFYLDSRGIPTIAIGRNIRDVGLSPDEINYLFLNDYKRVDAEISKDLPWVLQLDEVRQRVFYDLCFNMGIEKLLTFTHMIAFAQVGEWDRASDELHHSIWDSEVGDRASKLENMLRTGVDA